MASPEVLLIFPPVVYSNFGRYYPSTAVLAAFLDANGVPTAQLDLNQALLEWSVGPTSIRGVLTHEEQLLSSVAGKKNLTLNPLLRQLCAARVLAEKSDCFRDPYGKVYPAEHPKAPLELLGAMSYSYFLDPPLATVISSAFWELPQTRAFQEFLDESGVLDGLPYTIHTVGISVPMGPQLGCALVLAKMLRKRYAVRVVLGGSTITLLNREDIASLMRAHEAIDAVVRYQGELPLLHLANYFSLGGDEPWRVPGVLSISKGQLAGTSGVPNLPKLTELPFGLYEKNLLDRLATPEISVRQAEGCYWGQCAYCDYVELYPATAGRYRPQAVDRLIQEVSWDINRYGVTRFCLITEALPPKVGREMGKAIIESGLEIQWHSFAMVDPKFDIETLEIMAASGCRSLCIGIETVIDRVLGLVRKRATRDMTLRFLENCRKAGIKLQVNLIPNLPTTTRQEALEAFEVIENNLDGIVGISIFPFEATKSSAIGRSPERFGLRVLDCNSDMSGQAQFCANHLAVEDPAMSEEDVEYVVDRYRRLAARVSQKELDGSQATIWDADNWLEGPSFRFDERYAKLVIFESRNESAGPLLFNWLTGRMYHFAPTWGPIFSWLRARDRFHPRELKSLLKLLTGLGDLESEAVGRYVFGTLLEHSTLARDT